MADVLKPLRAIRDAHPDRPVLLVLTNLHDLTPGRDFTSDDAFAGGDGVLPVAGEDYEAMAPAIRKQLERFEGLFDRAVCVDLTPVEWGFAEPDYGGDRLKDAILGLLPEAQKHAVSMAVLQKSASPAHDHLDAKILAYACAAASAAAVPLPWVDLPVVAALQWHLTKIVAGAHNVPFDRTAVARMSALLGGRAVITMALRELAKIIPYVGSVVNASAAFGITYAAGKAADFYFRGVAGGHPPTEEEVRQFYAGQIEAAARLWKRSETEADASAAAVSPSGTVTGGESS